MDTAHWWTSQSRGRRALVVLYNLLLFALTACLVRPFLPEDASTLYAVNAFLTTDWLVMEALDLLLNKLSISQFFNSDYNKEFDREFAVGETVRVKLPNRGVIRDGLGYVPQPINRQYTTVSCNQLFGYDFEWDSYEKALKMERSEAAIKKEYIEPAVAQIAQEIESRCALWAYQNCPNIVGTLGTNPTTFDATSAAARQKLVELGCPPGKDRGMIVPPALMRTLKASSISYFNPVTDISKQFREGIVGSGDGFEWYESMSLYSHTAGTWAGTVETLAANQSGSSLSLTATTGDTFNVGDVFSIAGVNATNPMTRRSTGAAKTFVITAAVTAAASAATISIYPAIVGPGSPYQNVTALPAAGADLTLFPGTTTPNGLTGTNGLAIHPNSFALVGVELEMPKATDVSKQMRDPDSGIAIAFVRAFDARERKMINRFDTLIGFGNLYAENCCVRVLGA